MGRKLKIVHAIVLGSVLQGLGMALFLFPNHIPSGAQPASLFCSISGFRFRTD